VRLAFARGGRIGEDSLVDVHDHLIAIGARARARVLAALREKRLGEVPEGIGAPRARRRRFVRVDFCGNIAARVGRVRRLA
jgi:hypothetical protein